MVHITAIGDSITRNNHTRPYDTWPNIAFIPAPIDGATFGELSPNSGSWDLHDWTYTTAEKDSVKVYNAGVSGQQIQAINGRFDVDVLGHYSDIVIIHGGTNNRTDNGGTQQIHYDNLLAMVQRAKAAGVPRILLGTIPPRSDAWAAANLALYASYNDNIHAIASAEGCEVVDFRAALEDPANPGYYLPELTYDGLHPNLAGVTAMAAEVRTVVFGEYDYDVLLAADPVPEPMADYDFDVFLAADVIPNESSKMELYVLNRALDRIGIVSEYNALIWTTRLWGHGKASLKCLPDPMFAEAVFFQRSDTDEAMRIVRRHLSAKSGEPSLEIEAVGATWMFEKRVNWWTHTFNNVNLAAAAAALTADAQSTYAGVVRTIAGMRPLVDLTGAPHNITKQVSWGSVSDAVFEMCKEAGFGFGVRYANGGLEPYITRGVDRSASIVFADEYLDVASADVDLDESAYANLAVVGGQGEAAARIVTQQRVDDGIELAEMWVDAKDLSSESLTSEEYLAVLRQKGSESLAVSPVTWSFEATVTEDRYVFGVDYSLGDRVAYRALGYEGTDVLSEVTETFESGARTIDIALGKTAPTTRQLIDR